MVNHATPAAMVAQLYLLDRAGETVAAIAAWLLPRLGQSDTTPVLPTSGQLPAPVIDVLALLPTGWGYRAGWPTSRTDRHRRLRDGSPHRGGGGARAG